MKNRIDVNHIPGGVLVELNKCAKNTKRSITAELSIDDAVELLRCLKRELEGDVWGESGL